jgi:hypothetical protein
MTTYHTIYTKTKTKRMGNNTRSRDLTLVTVMAVVAMSSCSAFMSRSTSRSSAVRSLSDTATDGFTSDGAKTQIGNDSFLNEDLMARAQNGPGIKNKESLKIGIVGAGLAGMIAAMDLADAGHQVEMFELRPFVGGKVSSWQDKDDNHIEMGLHVFFGCYETNGWFR